MIRLARGTSQAPSLGRILAAGTALILVYFVLHAVHGVGQSLLLAFFGILLAIMLDVPTTALAAHMPRGLALTLALLALVGLVAGSVVLLVPHISAQLVLLARAMPHGLQRAGELWSRIAPHEALPWAAARSRIVASLPSVAERLVPFVNGTISVLSSTLVLFAVALFVSVDPRAELRWAARLVPPRHEVEYWRLIRRLGRTLRQWLLGMIVTLTIVAALTGVGLLLLGVPSWLALAFLTFVTGFVPYLGAVIAAVVVLAAGLAVSTHVALAALAVFIVGQTLQGVLISPVVNRRASRMPPALLLTWQLVMTASYGVLGLLAAQPLLAVAIVLIDQLYVERTLGRVPSGPDGRDDDGRRRRLLDHAAQRDGGGDQHHTDDEGVHAHEPGHR